MAGRSVAWAARPASNPAPKGVCDGVVQDVPVFRRAGANRYGGVGGRSQTAGIRFVWTAGMALEAAAIPAVAA